MLSLLLALVLLLPVFVGIRLMALGGLCCMLDPRYRMRKKLQEAS